MARSVRFRKKSVGEKHNDNPASAFHTILDKAIPELPILSNLRISYLDLIPMKSYDE
jgi:hypothetical protein